MKEERAFFLVEKWKYSSNDEECLQIQNLTRSQICHQSSLCATNYWTMRRKSWRSGFCFIRLNVLTLITQQLRHGTERGPFLSRWEHKVTLVHVIQPIVQVHGDNCSSLPSCSRNVCHTPSIFSLFSQPGDLIYFKAVIMLMLMTPCFTILL